MSESRSATTATVRPKIVVERTYRARVEELWVLWTTKDGFESWWGPEGFRAEVRTIDARLGGSLHYDMIAATPDAIAAITQMGRPISHEAHARFSELKPTSDLRSRTSWIFCPT
jgi:uncharacterized protein YndB with AHSA1/START domain